MEAFYGSDILLIAPFLAVCILQLVWLLISERTKTSKIPVWAVDLFFCVCLAFTLGTLFRQYPWTSQETKTDSSVFLYIGRQMHAGKIPYVDLFDHKGPLMYWIQYLGYAIWPNSLTGGVWLLEMLNAGALFFLMIKTAAYCTNDRRNAYLAILLLLPCCSFKLFQGGNFTEEYALPWIMLALLLFVAFLETGIYRPGQIIALGASCMVVLLLQVNLVTVWVALVPVVLIRFVHEKRFGDILRCILLFLLGMAIILTPVLFWAWRVHCAEAMWKYYILFNLVYTARTSSGLHQHLAVTEEILSRIWPAVLVMLVSLVADRKNKLQWMNLWFFFVSLLLVQVSGRASSYYLLILLPALFLPAVSFFGMMQRLWKREHTQMNRWLILLTCVGMAFAAGAHRQLSTGGMAEADAAIVYLRDQTSEDDNVLVIGNYARAYLLADRTTKNRFFFQVPPIQASDVIYQEFLADLENTPPDVVLVPEKRNLEKGYRWEGKLKQAVEMLIEKGYLQEQHSEFSVYLAPSHAD